MSDRIVLTGMRFEGRHGVSADERSIPQLIEVDVELSTDLGPAGRSDDLARTIDYGPVVRRCQAIVEERSFQLLEAIAEAIASDLLGGTSADTVVVRVRKLAVPMDIDIDHAAVEISRARAVEQGPASA